jgi:hypothetical protein
LKILLVLVLLLVLDRSNVGSHTLCGELRRARTSTGVGSRLDGEWVSGQAVPRR